MAADTFTLLSEEEVKDRPPRRSPGRPRKTSYEERVTELYAASAAIAMPFKPVLARTIMVQAPACGKAWDAWAKESLAVRKFLDRILTGAGVGGVLLVHMPIFLAAAAEFGLLPDNVSAMFAAPPSANGKKAPPQEAPSDANSTSNVE